MTKDKIKLFKALQKCVSDDLTRPFMCDVYYSEINGEYVATDGRICMIIKDDVFGKQEHSGYVTLVKEDIILLNKDGAFPPYKKVIPDLTQMKQYQCEITKIYAAMGTYVSIFSAKFGVYLDNTFIKRIPDNIKYLVHVGSSTETVVFVSEDLNITVLISPMKPDIDAIIQEA